VVWQNAFILGADFANHLKAPGGVLAAQERQIHLSRITYAVANDDLVRSDLLPAQLGVAPAAADHRLHHVEGLHCSKGRRLVAGSIWGGYQQLAREGQGHARAKPLIVSVGM